MLRLMASLLIAAALFLGGMQLSAYQDKKSKVISDIIQMLCVIESHLRYSCMPVLDLLRLLINEKKLDSLAFLGKCLGKLESGEPFSQAWKSSVESDRELCALLSDAKQTFLSLGDDIGTTDLEGQLGCCEYYKQIFGKELEVREENAKKYSKLYPVLGLSLGISAAIIII